MEISDIKRRVVETIERARRQAGERRTRIDEATREYEAFLDRIAIPVFKQVANVLRAEGYMFTVFTPGGSVRLMSDRAAEDYVELELDTTATNPWSPVTPAAAGGGASSSRKRPIGPPATLTEEDVLSFVLKSLEPLVER